MDMLERLKNRWKLKNMTQVFMVLLVFALTGTTVLMIKKPILDWVAPDGQRPLWFSITYFVLILPVYNLLLLMYGFLLGQFTFFWDFEKRFIKRMTGRTSKETE
ncbi:MAG: hypothetical protein IPL63_16295 [Saprospiraceae bacterium]|nr:hypothetical protein [Saprospiraceae bacterium]MBK6782922.1 hypothetical protein [Saprospiraceae bacterium]MBK7523428.1 hypothetical protein [Saprospiraceae bacterium]MBK8371582.1 hypothetical protein [Saprospiraceae bacterium]MBK8548847.1 hypothetical protein [Saprospiraceae bacterium]